MAYRLLGAHISATITGIPETIMEWKPPLVVLLDHSDVWHEVKAESPNTLFVGRVYKEHEPDFENPDIDPAEAASDHCEMLLPWADRMGETVSYWQGVNEPIIISQGGMQRYAAFEVERARIMDEHGCRVVAGSFSVGNPKLVLWNDFVPALEAAHQYDGALALHEYAWPTLDHEWPWYLLRHRKVYEGEPDRGWEGLSDHLRTLPLLITECGLDGLIEEGHTARGWRTLYGHKPREYLDQLAWYDAELLKSPYVAGAAIYCCGTADSSWDSYDIWRGVARSLTRQAKPIYRLQEVQPPEPVEPVVPPAPRWKMDVEHRAGPRIIAGTFPESGIELIITDPWGNASTVVGGSKPEYGEGGFEVLAPHVATYTLSFLKESFEVQAKGRTVLLTFVPLDETVEEPEPVEEPPEIAPPPTPAEPVAVPPVVAPPSVPAKPVEVPPVVTQPPVLVSPAGERPSAAGEPEEPVVSSETPLSEEEMMALIFERLDSILELLQERL